MITLNIRTGTLERLDFIEHLSIFNILTILIILTTLAILTVMNILIILVTSTISTNLKNLTILTILKSLLGDPHEGLRQCGGTFWPRYLSLFKPHKKLFSFRSNSWYYLSIVDISHPIPRYDPWPLHSTPRVGRGGTRQGCTNCGILASWLRWNGEKMRKWSGNGERLTLYISSLSLYFLPLSPFPNSLSISSLSFHFLHQNASHFVAKC